MKVWNNNKQIGYTLIFTTLWADSEDDKLVIFFPENRNWLFLQIVSSDDNLHKMLNSDYWKKKKNNNNKKNKNVCWKFYPKG